LSDNSPQRRRTRATVIIPLRLGATLGDAFWETAYVSPRFPVGIKGSDLANADIAIQGETMAIWFLANFVPATGTYFGFAEAQLSRCALLVAAEVAILMAGPLRPICREKLYTFAAAARLMADHQVAFSVVSIWA
jgi:hypothetical protein